MTKSNAGHFFEDFSLGQNIRHATPRTITAGETAIYTALTGQRTALFSSNEFAKNCGLPAAVVDPALVFNMVFGKTVPDISLNAVANLGYAEGRFYEPVYVGDTLRAESEVIGLKENANGKTGVVYVRTRGINQHGADVLSYVRWVMVNKRDPAAKSGAEHVPDLAASVAPEDLWLTDQLDFARYDWGLAGARHAFEDYTPGEWIDHVAGMTVEEAEHQLATRLYQNTAKVHFDGVLQQSSRFGRRLVYGGVVISLARALAFNGLENAALILAINGGRHVAPLFAGDTVYAASEVLAKADLGRAGALRLRLVAAKNRPLPDARIRNEAGDYDPAVVLDFDYWAAVPKR